MAHQRLEGKVLYMPKLDAQNKSPFAILLFHKWKIQVIDYRAQENVGEEYNEKKRMQEKEGNFSTMPPPNKSVLHFPVVLWDCGGKKCPPMVWIWNAAGKRWIIRIGIKENSRLPHSANLGAKTDEKWREKIWVGLWKYRIPTCALWIGEMDI